MIARTIFQLRCAEAGRRRARAARAFAALASLAGLLLAAPGAYAAQERMPLDGLGADGCDWNGCSVANLDEDPDGAGNDWATATDNNSNHAGHFTFGTPTQPLSAGADLQEFRASVRKNSTCGSDPPTARIELWESGALVRAGTAVSVTPANSCTQGTDCQVISFPWNATEVTSAANVEAKVFGIKSGGAPASRCAVDLGALEWNAEVGAVGPTLPTLSSPTSPFASIDTGGATLGATIDTNGGGTLTAYGTVWGASPAPTGNAATAGTDNPAMPHTYSHSRSITQTPGTLIYFRGYATNGAGTGYSPGASFYLEPNQASGVTFSNVTSSGMRISWSPPGTGAGNGSIVVVKQGSAVDSNPVDGVAHTANASFGSGDQLGTGNYVVFRAAGTQVDVGNLSASTTYHVAVYQYAGTAAPSINYQQDAPATGSQATSAAGSTPTLSTPTVSGIGSTSATLGATIDSGSGISAYGTVWGTSPAPTGNALAAGGAASPPHTFSHARTGLPASTRIYYRGYATNGAGTGYSPDGSFYTNPGSQASRINFMSAAETELIVSWTRGNGDGVIVLISESYAVDADPADETEYTANAAFGSGEQIGTGNYVIYVGTGTQVTVTGIQPDIPYYIAAYMYSGSGTGPGGINYLQSSPARGSSGHNGSHGINCVNCHFGTGALHGSFAVPRSLDQEAVCLTCHNETGVASAKKDVGLHTGTKYNADVDCGSCHEVHNNFDFATTDTHTGGVTAPNVEWLRSNTTKYVAGALEPALFQANTGFFAWDDANAPWNGVCQTCHQNTDFHRNDSSLGAGSHAHNSTADCRTCHSHADGFRGAGGDCTACHRTQREISANPGTYRRQITESTSGAGDGEFSTGFTSHHVNDGTGSQIVTKWDCVVCHAEGDAITGDTNATYHMKDGVQLKDTDTGVAYSDWPGLTPFERSSFCLSCHDADGATIITGRTDADPDATTDALNPFNDGVTNAHEPDGFTSMCDDLRTPCARDRDCSGIGSGVCSPLTAPHPRGRCSVTDVIACGTAYECPSGETCEFLQVVDVFSQFDPANASHHAVREQAYTSPAPFGSNLDNAIQGARTDLAWDSVLDCEDCHYGTATNMLQGHGTANARYMLRDKSGADTLPTPSSAGNLNVNCFRCHIPTGDPETYTSTESAYSQHVQGSHINDLLNLFGISCLNCHGGAEFGGIHGMDGPVTDDDTATSYNPNVFTWGSGLDLIDNWISGPGQGVSCSARQGSTLLSDCTQHGSQSYTRTPARTYRAP